MEAHPEGRFCHLWGFRSALEQAYGYECLYLQFFLGRQLAGVFPSIILRRKGWLISQPFNEYGGPLLQEMTPDHNRQVTALLLQAAGAKRCPAVEIRGGLGCEAAAAAAGWKQQPLHAYALLELGDPDHLWRRTITYEVRKSVNKARKAGLVSEVRQGRAAVEDPFYDLYLISMKRLGVPPHSRRFFDELAAGIGTRLVASWVHQDGRSVAILLGAATGKRIHIFVIASLPEAWALRPADLAHWTLIEWACTNGFRVFDFGSARYSGQIQFKKKWGVTFKDYGFYLIAAPGFEQRLRIETVRTSSRSMSTLAALWRMTVPIPVTRLLGPPIRKFLTK